MTFFLDFVDYFISVLIAVVQSAKYDSIDMPSDKVGAYRAFILFVGGKRIFRFLVHNVLRSL